MLDPKALKSYVDQPDTHVRWQFFFPHSSFAIPAQLVVVGAWWVKEIERLITEYTGMCLDYAKQHSAKSHAVVPGGAGKSVCCSAFPKAR